MRALYMLAIDFSLLLVACIFSAAFNPPPPPPSEPRGVFSEVGGRGAVCGGVGFTSVATVVAMDQYRNRRTRGGDRVDATITWTRIDGSRHR